MRTSLSYGEKELELEVREANLLVGRRADCTPNLADPVQSMREVLEHPLDYPALRLGLTPDDHVAILLDEGIPYLVDLLVPLLEQISKARVRSESITLIVPPPSEGQPWLDDLPEEFEDVRIEVHDPIERKKLAYLATTKRGRRVYLNRTAVDADQLVILTRRRYDPHTGYSGAEAALYPGIADQPVVEEFRTHFERRTPGGSLWPIHQEAREIAWQFGAPFFVQVIEGSADGIAHVLAGPLEASDAGQRLLDARWRVTHNHLADVVITAISGNPKLATLEEIARAFHAGSRVVQPGGSIVCLTEAAPELGPGFEHFHAHDDPGLLQRLLLQEKPADLTAAYLWTTAATQAKLFLLSGLPTETAEGLFTVPLEHARQAQKLLTDQATCILMPDGNKTLAVVE